MSRDVRGRLQAPAVLPAGKPAAVGETPGDVGGDGWRWKPTGSVSNAPSESAQSDRADWTDAVEGDRCRSSWRAAAGVAFRMKISGGGALRGVARLDGDGRGDGAGGAWWRDDLRGGRVSAGASAHEAEDDVPGEGGKDDGEPGVKAPNSVGVRGDSANEADRADGGVCDDRRARGCEWNLGLDAALDRRRRAFLVVPGDVGAVSAGLDDDDNDGGGGGARGLAWRGRNERVLPRTADGVKGWARNVGLSAVGSLVGERPANEARRACVRAEAGETGVDDELLLVLAAGAAGCCCWAVARGEMDVVRGETAVGSMASCSV